MPLFTRNDPQGISLEINHISRSLANLRILKERGNTSWRRSPRRFQELPSSFRLHLSLLMCSSRESQIIRLNVHVLWDSPNWIDDDVSALISGQSEGSCPCYVSSWLSWTVLLIVINIFSFIISIIDFLLLSSFHFQYCCYCITTSSSITAATSLLLLLLPILLLLLLFLILPLLILLLLLLLLLLLHYHYFF